MRTMIVAIAAVFLIGTAGCEFTNSEKKKTQAATAADIAAMRDDVGRLRVEVEALKREMKDSERIMRGHITSLQKNLNDVDAKAARRVNEAQTKLVNKINEIERKRVNDKNALNEKMDAIVGETRRALGTAPTSGTATRTVRGIEHTVKEGETVSAIAAMYRDRYGNKYNATTKAILEANNLSATSIIHPGDVLLIPLKE